MNVLSAIQLSEHFVYIENQFFITSYVPSIFSSVAVCLCVCARTVVDDVPVENKIGDALVNRIIRAHHDGIPWRACILIPLLPGFSMPVDHSDASAVRICLHINA